MNLQLSANSDFFLSLQSEDSASVHSFGEESDYGSVFNDLPAMAETHPPNTAAKSLSSVGSAISREDLKQALLSVMSRKDELQNQCSALKKLLEQVEFFLLPGSDKVDKLFKSQLWHHWQVRSFSGEQHSSKKLFIHDTFM